MRIKLPALAAALLLAASAARAQSLPPMVSGNVATARKDHLEWFLGTRYQKAGAVERQLPFNELIHGITDNQEAILEIPYVSADGQSGFGDLFLGTQYRFIGKGADPGVAGSFGIKLDNGSRERGLGTGAKDYDLRLRAQAPWEKLLGLANFGYTFVGEPTADGVKQERRDVLFGSLAAEYPVFSKAGLLGELYMQNSDVPGQPNRLAGDVGFRYYLNSRHELHAMIGKSLRQGNAGGPQLRIYAGIRIDFSVREPP